MTSAKIFAAAMLAIGGVAFTGCDNDNAGTGTNTRTTKTETRTETTTDNNARTAADRTGAAANNAVDNTRDTARTAGDKTGDALHNAADKTGNAINRAGDAVGLRTGSTTQPTAGQMIRDEKKIRDVLQEITQAALTKNGFDDIVERFHKDDRQRLHDYANKNNFDDINAKVAEINDAWKSKFGSDFKIKDRDAVFNDQWARISEGSRDLARTAADRSDANKPADDKAIANTGDRDYATVTIASSHNMPDVTLNVVYDGLLRGYKVDVPDTLDGQKLHDNLLKHLNMIAADKDKWPGDVNEASREIAHHVLASLSDKDMSNAGGANANP